MGKSPTFVVVGAGPCGASAVASVRGRGFEGRIVVIGDEHEAPYERPPLSKEFLSGKMAAGDFVVHPAGFYADHEVELRLGVRAVSLHLDRRAVALEDGDTLPFDRVLLTTGGRARMLPGMEPADRVCYLRSLADSRRLADHLRTASRLLVVGAGLIGCEIAATARRLGLEVVVFDAAALPMQAAIGRTLGAVLAGIHHDEGVSLRMGEPVATASDISGSALVETVSGQRIEGDVVVVGAGLIPNCELAEQAGIACRDGVLVDAHCESSAESVYAAGDVARHQHPLFGELRVEHHMNAVRQGAAAGHNLWGSQTAYDDPHWFWSDQYDHNLQAAGVITADDRLVVRGSSSERNLSVFGVRDGRIRGLVALNRGQEVMRARRLIQSQALIDVEQLADEGVDLRQVAVAGR